MESRELWQAFLETGAPEMYILYNRARKMESLHVFNDSGSGAAGHQLQ